MKDLTKELYFNGQATTTENEIEALAVALLGLTWSIKMGSVEKEINLKDLGWKFEFNMRKKAAGLCSYTHKTIYISKYLLQQNYGEVEQWEETVRHELAHAVDYVMRGKSDHSKYWKAVARQVLSTGERCYSGQVIKDKQSKYTLVCDTCNKETAKHKRPKLDRSCGTCGKEKYGKRGFRKEFILRVVQNY